MSTTVSFRRGRVVRLVVVVLCAACLVGVAPAAPAAPSDDRPHRWSGDAIPANGEADGGWIGGYRVGTTPVFVTTPARSPNTAGYGPPRFVDDAPGRVTSRSETARAAWILSKYGDYRDATQAAAVDASVYHLLAGGRWRWTAVSAAFARCSRSGGSSPTRGVNVGSSFFAMMPVGLIFSNSATLLPSAS